MALESIFGVHLSTASLLLRLAIGSVYVIHGYPKLGTQRKSAADWLKSMGLPAGFATFAAVVEFFGGIAILLGILTPIIAALFALYSLSTMLLQRTKMKSKYIGGYELDTILILISLALATIGGGRFSLDHLLRI